MLRVAYAGYDFFSSCLEFLVGQDDVEVVLCLTGRPDEAVANVIRLASINRIPLVFGRPDEHVVETVNRLDVDLLVSAAYSYRIPIERIRVGRAVNLHPSLLPDGRGPNPLPYLVDGRDGSCGLSLHVLTPELDQGAVLHQTRIELQPGDGFDELSLRMFAAAPALLQRLLSDLNGSFAYAAVQGPGSYWPGHSEQDRLVRAAESTSHELRAAARKYGLLGVVVELADGQRVQVDRLTTVRCDHAYPPGTMVATLRVGSLVALRDGLARLDTRAP